MLVQLGVEMGGYEGAMSGVHALPFTQHTRAQAARQLHFILNAPVLQSVFKLSMAEAECCCSLVCTVQGMNAM